MTSLARSCWALSYSVAALVAEQDAGALVLPCPSRLIDPSGAATFFHHPQSVVAAPSAATAVDSAAAAAAAAAAAELSLIHI